MMHDLAGNELRNMHVARLVYIACVVVDRMLNVNSVCSSSCCNAQLNCVSMPPTWSTTSADGKINAREGCSPLK